MSSITRHRPPFPSGWSSFPISPSNLTLANTLPIGQSFLWHRHQLLPEAVPATTDLTSSALPAEVPVKAELDTPAKEIPTEEFSRALLDPPRVVCLRQTTSRVYYTAIYPEETQDELDRRGGVTEKWLRDYFHLDKYPSLEAMYAEWRERDPNMFGRLEMAYEGMKVGEGGRARGVRLLRQDPWECLIAFITSTNNHIPRIAGLMHRLGTHFSPPLLTLPDPAHDAPPAAGPSTPPPTADSDVPTTTTYHLFPAPHLLPVVLEQTLRDIGFGYRAGFIESSLATLRTEFGDGPGDIERGLAGWRGGEVDVVREKLIGLKGVGRKVADCVMLMCLDQPHLIPIDTHLSAIAARHPLFPSRLKNKPMSKALYDEVQEFLLDKWGPMGGWAQAVMFALELPDATVSKGAKGSGAGSTPKKTPKKGTVMSEIGTPIKAEEGEDLVKLEEVGEGSAQAWRTPVKEPGMGLDSPAPTPTRSRNGSTSKRKLATPKRAATMGDQVKTEEGEGDVFTPGGLPAGYGFKRTRSAARVELQRKESGVGVLAEDVKGLGLDE